MSAASTQDRQDRQDCQRLCIVIDKTDNLYTFLAHAEEHKYTTEDVCKLRLGKQGELYLPVIDGTHPSIFKALPGRYSSIWICLYETKHIGPFDFANRIVTDYTILAHQHRQKDAK